MDQRPNFFIVGAPKCGTTALWEYLRHHPNIYFPGPKEPHFFAGDLKDANRGSDYRETIEGYLALFNAARECHTVRGEASVWYLFAPGAIERIMEFEPSAKIVVMVRNPIEMAHSLHHQHFMNFQDDVGDFETAWRLQHLRRQGERIPRTNTDPRFLQYQDLCSLGSQLSRLYTIVSPQQVKAVVFDDLAARSAEVYSEVLRFLELPHDGRESFPRINESQAFRMRWLGLLNRRIPRVQAIIRLKRRLGLPYRSHVRVPHALVMRRESRPAISPHFRAELGESLAGQVQQLSMVLDRDLSYWLEA